ncbi:MAG: hypothetical protein C0506_06035 [Anaerolinea sp.]|nr:hypothetical protein [Anaerolinea sp.]
MLDPKRPFYTFVREERQFCAVLAHLLMQKGPNLGAFLNVVNARTGSSYPTEYLDEAEIYLEFAFLRDAWELLNAPLSHPGVRRTVGALASINQAKHTRIRLLLDRSGLTDFDIPSAADPATFNERFMGRAGRSVKHDISSPGRWSIPAMLKHVNGGKDVPFGVIEALAKLKWCFNIKPDLVLMLPGQPVLCVEAKLESGEGTYPSGDDAEALRRAFPTYKKPWRQFDIQAHLFGKLLAVSHTQIVVSRSAARPEDLTWAQVFGAMEMESSIPFVSQLVHQNKSLGIGGS